MQPQSIDWRGGITLGAVAGICLGVIALVVNEVSGIIALENGFASNLVAFTVGGAIFGLVASGFLSLLKERLPFRSIYLKAVIVATGLWATLEAGGIVLSAVQPDRYHFQAAQLFQGLVLSLVLGGLLGLFWKIRNRQA